jgi:transglutaminase-like putative cysteine protease/Flp pilus assembly protein TadD
MWRWRAVVLAFLSLSSPSLNSSGRGAANGWNLPRFTSDGATLYSAASAVTAKPGTDVIVLDQENSFVFDADGKAVRNRYLVYKILTQKGVDGWDAASLGWEPWHEERPTILARVVTPDGVVHPLDPKTITDSLARDEDEKTYGDGREVRTPLPAIAPGSVVEEEMVLTETAPFFGAGIVERDYFGGSAPTQRSLLVLDAPASLPLRYAVQLLPDVKREKKEADGRVQMVFEQGWLEAWEEAEKYVPKDVPMRPAVTFSNGVSWQSIAEGYGKIVDEKASEKDVQAIVTKLTAAKTTREEKAAAIQQYLSREVRYTGVEFGDAAIVPHAPAETLKQKYGDCKDKATLAVAMLRAAGVPAYVALLSAGQRQDVAEDLPGMGMFDHAIVYAPGSPEIWIDATDEYARLGQLPQADQGRKALIASKESAALVTVPESGSQNNRIVEKREFYLAENGPAGVVETTEPHGVFESEYRSAYADAEDKDRKKNVQDYIKNEYVSEKLTKVERSDPRDLTKQFRLVLEASGAKRGYTELDSAAAAIRLESLFTELPSELREKEKEPAKGADEASDQPKKPRTADYQLPQSFVHEWQYRIVPGIGFQAKALPPATKIALGPAVLTEEFSKNHDGSVVASFKFDTVKQRLTVAEATELRNKVAELRAGPAVVIYFEPTTQALMNQGLMREAFLASRDLIKEHPAEGVHHLQRAKLLLAAGMGQAARDEAEAAVKLEPGSALAQKTLAEILEYDLVGRQFRRGSDYAGAEAAYRAAAKLDPADHTLVANLAILLEHNAWGLRYGPGAKLKEAIAEYRKLKPEDLADMGVKNNLAFALFYNRDFAEAKKSGEDLNPQPMALLVACEAALNGPQAGLAEAREQTGSEEQSKQVASMAGQLLENLRIYPAAADLLDAGAAGGNAAATSADASLFHKTKPHEGLSFPDDAVGVAMHYYLLQASPDFSLEQLASLCSRNGKPSIATPFIVEALHKDTRATLSWKSRANLFAEVGFDLSVTLAQPKVEGDDSNGYRVTLWSSAKYKDTTYVVKEDGHYKVLATKEIPIGIGLESLDRLEAGNLAGARILLDWLRDDWHLPGGDDPLAGWAFSRLWTKGKEADSTVVKAAAAAILANYKDTAVRAIAALESARNSIEDENQKANIDLSLLAGYYAMENYEKVVAVTASLAKRYPESERIFLDESFGLRVLGRFDEANQLAEERLRRLPGDVAAMRSLVANASTRDDYVTARATEQKIIDAGKAESQELNGMAWLALFTGKVEASDLEDALKAARLSQNSAAVLHTLGSVYAEVGKTKEARDVLVQAMDLLNLDEPDDNYWYAFGRIAEQDGEIDTARSDYTRVTKPKRPIDVHDSSYRLAQMRLKAMGSAANAPGDGNK